MQQKQFLNKSSCDTGHPQKTRKTSDKQLNLPPKRISKGKKGKQNLKSAQGKQNGSRGEINKI